MPSTLVQGHDSGAPPAELDVELDDEAPPPVVEELADEAAAPPAPAELDDDEEPPPDPAGGRSGVVGVCPPAPNKLPLPVGSRPHEASTDAATRIAIAPRARYAVTRRH